MFSYIKAKSYIGVIESVHDLLSLLDGHRPIETDILVPAAGQVERCQGAGVERGGWGGGGGRVEGEGGSV